jgi:hypothetical protein
MIVRIGLIGLLWALAGCGSSAKSMTGPTGTGGAGVCGTKDGGFGAPSGGSMSWQENGMPDCALTGYAARDMGTAADVIQIYAETKDAKSVNIVLSSDSGPLGGTYTCQPGNATTAPKVTFDYVGSHGGGSAAMSECSVTVSFSEDSAGTQQAKGTFSGTVASDAIDGGTYDITDGVFVLTVTPTGG